MLNQGDSLVVPVLRPVKDFSAPAIRCCEAMSHVDRLVGLADKRGAVCL